MLVRLTASILLLFGLPAFGAHWYVRRDATGADNGVDWVNAWTNTTEINWDIIHAGDSIWIAGGMYDRLDIRATGTVDRPLYIARVRSSNVVPVKAAGWNPAFDSTVIIDTIGCHSDVDGGQFYGSYMTIDGQIPYTGMVVTNTSTGCLYDTNVIDTYSFALDGSYANYVTLLNLDICGRGTDDQPFGCRPDYGSTAEGRCFSDISYLMPARGLRIAYCQLHNMSTIGEVGNQSDMIIEHNIMYNNLVGNPAVNHPNLWVAFGCTNVLFRYNTITNWQVEGIMLTPNGPTDLPNANWRIYGNLWADAIPGPTRILESQYTTNGPIYFFNNTCVNAGFGISTNGTLLGGAFSPDSASSNNIYFRAGGFVGIGFHAGNDDYDLTDEEIDEPHGISGADTNIFANYDGRDYHIIKQLSPLLPRNKAATLRAEFNKDLDGYLRGVDGWWDIGAYEFPSIPELQSPTVTKTNVTVKWSGDPTLTYFILRTTNLTAYFPLASNIAGQSPTTTFIDTNPPNPKLLFYRVGVQPSGQ